MKHCPGLFVLRVFLAGCAIILMAPVTGKAERDSTHVRRYNTVKIDLTSRTLFRSAFVVSYERVINPNQSITFTAGYQEMPMRTKLAPNVQVQRSMNSNGLKFGAEYRFYLPGENKYPAPRGVYLGPYFSAHLFDNQRDIQVMHNDTLQNARLNSRIDVANIGLQVGYQFLIKKRWSIDLVILGPSFSYYKAKLNMTGDYTFDPDDISNEILEALIDRFPGLGDLISGENIVQSGRASTWAYGWRYQFHIGYHFGRK